MKIKLCLLFLLVTTFVFAQQKQVVTSIDTIKNKIGAEFKLSIKTTVDTSSKVIFPNLKNFGALEVIQSYPIDTIKKNDRYELIKNRLNVFALVSNIFNEEFVESVGYSTRGRNFKLGLNINL